MPSSKLKIRGNLDSFIHTGALLIVIIWIIVAIAIFVISKGAPEQAGMQKFVAGLFLFVLLVPTMGILVQTISVDDKYIYYSSNFFPLIKRNVKVSEISSINFGRNFLPAIDPTGFSKLILAKTDQPIVGLIFYNKQNQIIGGINTKVYKQSDIKLIINKLTELNPEIKVGSI